MTDSITIVIPQSVVYCDACGMPPEYCSYGPDFETHCVPWLKANAPKLAAQIYGNRKTPSAAEATAGGSDESTGLAPLGPWTARERLGAFYALYMPEKLDGIDAILDKYEGKEDKLFVALVRKYGPEPEDPFLAAAGSDCDDDAIAERLEGMDVAGAKGKKKRRGAAAKKVNKVETRVIVQKILRNRKKAVTHVIGMDTIPGIKLKDASKAFSKRFAGSSSVKEKEIIIQGDHLEDVAEMIVKKFGVNANAIFLDLDGGFVPFGE